MGRKRNNRLNKIMKNKMLMTSFVGILLLIVIVIAIINIFIFNKELKTKKLINEKVYIYFLEHRFDFMGNITLNHDNSISEITLNNKKTKLNSEPIYYKNKKRIILPTHYNYIATGNGVQKKVLYFTELEKKNNSFYLKNKDLNYKMSHDVLYDGSDIYIFVDEVDIVFADKKITIPPLSYAYYQYSTRNLYIYNYEQDKVYYFSDINQDVIAQNSYYKINLSSDSIFINKKDKLLMKNFDYLKKMK